MSWLRPVLLIVLAAGAAIVLWFRIESGIRSLPKTAAIPDYELENADISTFDEAGMIRYRLQSPYVAQYLSTDTARLKTPTLWYYREARAPIRIDATQGEVTQHGEQVVLHGQVRLERPATPESTAMELRTSEVHISVPDKLAITANRATARGEGYEASGVGASLDLEQGLYRIHSQAMSVHEPR